MLRLIFLCLFTLFLTTFKLNAQSSYCTPTNTGSNSSFFISKVSFSNIFNTSNNSAAVYEYYDTLSTDVIQDETYATSITYKIQNHNEATLKVWVDFNGNGSFNDSGETVYSYTTSEPYSADGITRNFQISIPSSATIGNTRMRVAVNRNNLSDACIAEYQAGEMEDYDITIKPSPVQPTANCVGAINLTLDALGKASITTNDVNNNSFDDFDATNDLILSLDKYNFDCTNVSSPTTVTLTVTDSDGLSSTCTTNVNVSAYSGSFTAPVLDDVVEYCSYTASTPIMNFQCGQEITATTSDTTSFSTAGSYTINWTFNNGTTSITSTQNITILDPVTPTNVTISNISETSAKINWTSSDTGVFSIIYRLNGTSDTWTETTSTTNTKTITGLDDGLQYEVKIKTVSSCGSYSSIALFTTVEVEYCDDNVNLNKDNSYYISNVNIGNINNSSSSTASVYEHYNTISTDLTIGETFSGDITYTRGTYNTTVLVVWIDFNNNGDFTDAGDEILTVTNSGDSNSVFTIPITNILVPSTATLGKTRLRIGLKRGSAPTSACNFDHEVGEIEDYDVYLTAPNDTAFESAMFTQVYNYNNTDNWIEITNINNIDAISSNKIALALYKDTSGDQTNIVPSATYLVNSNINPGESILIKKPSSTITNTIGTVIENSSITDFDNNDDILIITKKTDATAWTNRYDVVSNIKDNSSLVRSDDITTYNSVYTSNEWVEFVDDNLSTSTNPPERHPHDPLISEVISADITSNVKLGVHNINKTILENNLWTNGYPDRSRNVLVNQDISLTEKLSAKNLEITSLFKLAIENNSIEVTDYITINANSEIKLSGTSQLIQTHIGTSNISGTGKLFVDQNSTVESIYRYNYLTSPVTSVGLNTYTTTDILKDGTIATTLNSTAKDINFISGYDGSYVNSPIDAIQIPEYWIYTYDNANYIHKYSTGTINPGKGYLLKGPGRAQNYTFVGTPNDGDYSFTTSGDMGLLLGNPYSSSINSKKFIEDNLDSTTGTLYFWEHVGEEDGNDIKGHYASGYIGGYATRNISMGISANNVSSNDNTGDENVFTYTEPKQYIPIAQGFFATSDSDGGTIVFNNSQRAFITEGINSVLLKTQNKKNNTTKPVTDIPILKLEMNYIEDELYIKRKIGISFNSINSLGYERGYDSEIYDLNATDFYWKILNDEKKYIISGVQEINENLEVPLAIIVNNSTELSINIYQWNLPNQNIYLIDKLTNKQYLLNENAANLNLDKGDYLDRFFIGFKIQGALNLENSLSDEDITLFYDENLKEINISSFNNFTINTAKIYSILGQEINFYNLTNQKQSEYKLKTTTIKDGIYIIQLTTDKGIYSKKIILK
jgi:hypothetical protein